MKKNRQNIPQSKKKVYNKHEIFMTLWTHLITYDKVHYVRMKTILIFCNTENPRIQLTFSSKIIHKIIWKQENIFQSSEHVSAGTVHRRNRKRSWKFSELKLKKKQWNRKSGIKILRNTCRLKKTTVIVESSSLANEEINKKKREYLCEMLLHPYS